MSLIEATSFDILCDVGRRRIKRRIEATSFDVFCDVGRRRIFFS